MNIATNTTTATAKTRIKGNGAAYKAAPPAAARVIHVNGFYMNVLTADVDFFMIMWRNVYRECPVEAVFGGRSMRTIV